MTRLLTAVLLLLTLHANSQALRDINFSYLYNPGLGYSFQLQPVRFSDHWEILYRLSITDTLLDPKELSIEWQGRESISRKEYSPLDSTIVVVTKTDARSIYGNISISTEQAPKVIVAKVIDNSMKKASFYYKELDANYPVDNYTVKNDLNKYITKGSTHSFLKKDDSLVVSFYNDNFPAAAPAFSETQAKVSKGMVADSIINIVSDNTFTFAHNGLYLFQKDTMAARGFALRAEDDYPRIRTIENLFGPMIYICTKQEYDKLEASKGQKKVFDRTILNITGNVERAKHIIRNYFRRVELANEYFTSYKEGWKTDRGMIFIVFGLPDEVFRYNDREVWNYNNSTFIASFSFVKASSVFDPDNYVLIRDRKYQRTWYEVVDLWRNARF